MLGERGMRGRGGGSSAKSQEHLAQRTSVQVGGSRNANWAWRCPKACRHDRQVRSSEGLRYEVYRVVFEAAASSLGVRAPDF